MINEIRIISPITTTVATEKISFKPIFKDLNILITPKIKFWILYFNIFFKKILLTNYKNIMY
ncbi:hypothetical protein B10525_15140 [Campylobacter jejuni]|nr:hypothetical protein B10525_15140 [Campylobacter jejuni]